MRNLISFFKSKQFFVQISIILVLIFLVFFITLQWLSSYTNHGKFVTVPDFKGQKISLLEDFIKDKGVSYEIIDSIYDPKEKAGIVLRQDPEVNIAVKHNRTIYLYVTGMVAPQIIMPKLVDKSERQARFILGSYGLKTGKITEQAADCNGCVLSQLLHGKKIEEGSLVKKGTVIELIVGRKDHFYNSGSTDSTLTNEEPDFDN
ncbi:PASTA domain-containing protein [Aurantibacillus circumpalustris]|uniref:PASTA domain-containing protein n=1 Tax=Aurantibacillus circumpalustris TaxID=3036359 RepID=UPI00295BF52B|nr:PASTA domain-containing protein [Aurantibacillus circumpalustris]